MSDEFDISLLNYGSILKKGYSKLIANLGKTVAVITLIVSAIISFADIGFSDIHAESFTTTLVMMLIASYVMYFSLEDAGEQLGRETEGYKNAVKLYLEKKENIRGDDISSMRHFCLEYLNEELEYRKSNALLSLGYTKEELEAFRRGEKVSKRARRALSKIDKIKRSHLSVQDLLSKSDYEFRTELRRPGIEKLLFMLKRLIPSTVCMLFTVSVIVNAKEGLTLSTVIEGIIKLSTLPIIGLKGYSAGYEYITCGEISRLETKTNLLDAFIKKKDK